MTRPDSPELSEHLRRAFNRDLRSRIAASADGILVDSDPARRESRRRHARALAAARMTYDRVWKRMEADSAPREGNR